MRDDQIKAAVDKFLKNVTFSAQREMEKAIKAAIAAGTLKDGDTPSMQVTLASVPMGLNVTIHKRFEL